MFLILTNNYNYFLIFIKNGLDKNTHKKKYKTCGNKSCKTETGGWALKFTRVKSENNGYIMLCTNCAKAHRKGQFCFYCKQIYLDNDDDGKDWIQCDFCKKWVL